MGFRDDREAMLARIRSLEGDLARATATAVRVPKLDNENQKLRAELAEYKARYDMPTGPKIESRIPGSVRPLAFRIREPRAPWREVTVSRELIKIGKLSSSHIRVNDDNVSRMHAVIEVTEAGVSIIDLGSSSGTFVNGKKANKVTLSNGDRIRVGETEIIIGIGA